jgi:hypothetical protein
MLGFVLPQSLSYPKLWMEAFANSGSFGSQYRGQNSCSSSPERHVFIDPPRRPCTKTRSIKGSGAENRVLKPSGPIASSLSVGCVLADPKLRAKKELPLRVPALARSSCPSVGVFSVGESVGASERDEGNTSDGAYFERERERRSCYIRCRSAFERDPNIILCLPPSLHRRCATHLRSIVATLKLEVKPGRRAGLCSASLASLRHISS